MNTTHKTLLLTGFITCSAIFLPGCPAIVVGAAGGAAATAVVYDHRAIDTIVKDNDIANQVYVNLHKNADINSQCHIVATAFRSNVLLAGQAPTEDLRQQAVDIAKKVPGVKRIYNEITLEEPSSISVQSNDTWITSKVKAQFLATKGLSSSHFKVVTVSGTVFLIGEVTHDQADLAVNVARQIKGVQKIVKIFDYVTTPNS